MFAGGQESAPRHAFGQSTSRFWQGRVLIREHPRALTVLPNAPHSLSHLLLRVARTFSGAFCVPIPLAQSLVSMAAGGNFPHPNPPFAASLAVDQEDEEISKLPTAFANALPERKTKSPSLPPPYAINGGHSTSTPPSLPAINASRVDAEGVSKPPPLEMDPIRTSAGSPSPVTFHSGYI